MPSNLSADERAAVEKLRAYVAHTRSLTVRVTAGNPPTFHYGITDRELDLVDTLLAVVARAGEAVADASKNIAIGKRLTVFARELGRDHPRYITLLNAAVALEMSAIAHPADARDRGDASADTRRLDWMDSNSFTAYRSRDPETSELCDHAVVVAEDAPSRFGNIGTIRAAIDHAMHAAPAAPEDK